MEAKRDEYIKKINEHSHLQRTYKYGIKYAHKDNTLHRLVYPTVRPYA